MQQRHSQIVVELEQANHRLSEAEGALRRLQRKYDRDTSDLTLQVERARMLLEDNLGKMRQLEPEAIEARVEASLQAAEHEVREAIAKAEAATDQRLEQEREEMQKKSAEQAEMVTGMRKEWMQERQGLVNDLEAAKAAHARAVDEINRVRAEASSELETEKADR